MAINVSIKMIQISSDSVTIQLKIIFEGSLKKEYFQKSWKIISIFSIHKEEDKILVKS